MVIPLIGCGPDEPVGSTFTVALYEHRPDGTPVPGMKASAVFTVTAPGTGVSLPHTGGGWARVATRDTSPLLGALALAPLGVGIVIRRRRAAVRRVRHAGE